MKLEGEVSIVTGAGRGIGREIALTHAREGAKVALLARTPVEIEATAAAIGAAGGTAIALPVDMLDLDAVKKAFAAAEAKLGAPSVLVNNAAVFKSIGPIWDVDPDEWWRDVETNIRGTFNGCRAVVEGMMARKRGRIINMAGGGAGGSFPHGSGYATGKTGIVRFTECFSDTLKGSGVLAFVMDPGLVRTSMTEFQLTSRSGQTYLPNIQDLFDKGIAVPPTLAARLSVEIASGRFDKLAGRVLWAAREDEKLGAAAIDEVLANDLRTLRMNGTPVEKPYRGG